MLILGLCPSMHDSTACLFEDYRLLAAVSQERLSRRKGDGGDIPVAAMDECLAIAGRRRDEVDAVVLNRMLYSERYFRHLRGYRWAKARLRAVLGIDKRKFMDVECERDRRVDSIAMFDGPKFLADFGFRPDTDLSFCNHHLAHALPCLFHTDWPEALIYTADGVGDNTQYSVRLFGEGKLETIYGGDERLLQPRNIDGLGEAYGMATQALGFIRNRHEGKVTGLAAYGQPTRYEDLAAHFRVDDAGMIQSDFPSYGAMEHVIFELAGRTSREDMAASMQRLLENFILESVGRILSLHPRRFLGAVRRRLRQCAPQPAPGRRTAGGGDFRFPRHGRPGPALWLRARFPVAARRDGTLAGPAPSYGHAIFRPGFRFGHRRAV